MKIPPLDVAVPDEERRRTAPPVEEVDVGAVRSPETTTFPVTSRVVRVPTEVSKLAVLVAVSTFCPLDLMILIEEGGGE